MSIPCSAIDEADTLVANGTAMAKKGKRAQAIGLFRRAIGLRPECAQAHHNLGVALSEEKEFILALSSFREALRYHPNYAEAHFNLGNALGELGRGEEGIIAFKAALRIKPDYVDAYNNLGLILTRLGRPGEAAAYLAQAVRLKPDVSEGHNNLGLAHVERGDFAAAEACYQEALRLNPHYADAHTNLGSAFKEQGRLEEALACYDLALAYEPDSVTTRWNRSLAWLQMGNFAQGWPEYEWRFKRKGTRACSEPRWDGSPLEGRTLLVHAEQGIGDVLQFLRYVPLISSRHAQRAAVTARGACLLPRIIVAAPPILVPLIATCPGVNSVVAEDQELPACDLHVSIMSLPGILGTTLSTIPVDIPYLKAEPEQVERWRECIRHAPRDEDGMRSVPTTLGIVWQGNPRHKWDRHRSFPLAMLEPLARIDGVRLVSLQKEVGSEQVGLLGGRFPVLDLGPQLEDFRDTAALISCLDVVITCDTSVAHLAGALGVKVWVALSTIVDWRWLLARDDSPWYPTMRLFRQERLGEWRPVFERMAAELGRTRILANAATHEIFP